jgi:hypothetical protein
MPRLRSIASWRNPASRTRSSGRRSLPPSTGRYTRLGPAATGASRRAAARGLVARRRAPTPSPTLDACSERQRRTSRRARGCRQQDPGQQTTLTRSTRRGSRREHALAPAPHREAFEPGGVRFLRRLDLAHQHARRRVLVRADHGHELRLPVAGLKASAQRVGEHRRAVRVGTAPAGRKLSGRNFGCARCSVQAIAKAGDVRGNAARLVSAPVLCLRNRRNRRGRRCQSDSSWARP